MLLQLWYLLSLCFNTISANYLNIDNYSISYVDIPTTGIIPDTYRYPNTGFGCSVSKENETYLITSTGNPYQNSNEKYKCRGSLKYVEIMKYDLNVNNFTDNLIIGQSIAEYPDAVGDLGTDYVVTCGLDETHNILYYIGSNIYIYIDILDNEALNSIIFFNDNKEYQVII